MVKSFTRYYRNEVLLMTEEEKIQYEKELNSYLEIEEPKVASKLKEMGFEIKS